MRQSLRHELRYAACLYTGEAFVRAHKAANPTYDKIITGRVFVVYRRGRFFRQITLSAYKRIFDNPASEVSLYDLCISLPVSFMV